MARLELFATVARLASCASLRAPPAAQVAASNPPETKPSGPSKEASATASPERSLSAHRRVRAQHSKSEVSSLFPHGESPLRSHGLKGRLGAMARCMYSPSATKLPFFSSRISCFYRSPGIRPTIARNRPICSQNRSIIYPKSTTFGPKLTDIYQNWPVAGTIRQEVGQICPDIGQVRLPN